MIKLLNKEQIRELDNQTIIKQGISSIQLMERAAKACVTYILNLFSEKTKNLFIICGKGNNGGDGLAIARLIENKIIGSEIKITVFIIDESSSKTSSDFEINCKRLKEVKRINTFHINEATLEDFNRIIFTNRNNSIIIDAIYGTGLNKEIIGNTASVIKNINESLIPIISIDLPSGILTNDVIKEEDRTIVNASLTLSFQQPKLSFLIPETGKFCGEFIVLDIGLDQEYINQCDCENYYIERRDISSLLKKRQKFSHKGTFGHALIIAGSKGKMGAAILASKSCLKSGAGLLTTHIPNCGTVIMQTSVPEAMVSEDSAEEFISTLPHLLNIDAVGFGPGIGKNQESAKVLKQLIQQYQGKLVLDADGINLISDNKTLLAFVPPLSILTPHPIEFDRLTEKHNNTLDRIETAKQLASKYHLIIILKGAHTAIITPNKNVYFNSTGNPGLAKGGSGDVLTGILTGLLTRGYSQLESALIGVYLHGLTADLFAEASSEESIFATDLIENISEGFIQIEK